ncbi:MAG: lamin tail domain-containing protein [Marinoscillum sp.]
MTLRTTVFYNILLLCFYVNAQVEDDFSDGDFITAPAWSGNISDFEIDEDLKLHLNAVAATAESYIVTSSTLMDKTIWEFYVEMGFNPSSGNQLFVYLASNQEDLTGDVDGYLVRLGNTEDEVSLYKQSGTTLTKIIDGEDDILDVSTVAIRVKVVRDENGNWELFRDTSGGTAYTSEGSVNDVSFTSSAYFGFRCDYTSTRSTLFWMDEIMIDQVQVDTVVVNSSTEIEVTFNQSIGQSDAETIGDYSISGLTINSAAQDGSDETKVLLTLDGTTPLSTSVYTLNIDAGITKNSSTSYYFSYVSLDLETLLTLSDTEVELTFNDELDETSAETLSNYNIDNGIGQPTAVELDSENPKMVKLTLANQLFESTTFQLAVSGLNNSKENSTFSGTEDFTFVVPVIMDTVEAKSEHTILVRFNKELDQTIAETLTNYSLDGSVGNPTTATLQPDNESVELTFGVGFSDATYTLTVNNLEDVDGNVITPNTQEGFDYLNLAISSITQVDDLSVLITFNQVVDELSSETSTNYSISEIGVATSAVRSAINKDQVTVSWSELYNSSYDLTISGVSNNDQNSTSDQLELSFAISKATAERSILINEFLADPTPVVGLPDAEYIELYNPTSHSVNLEDFALSGETIPAYILESGAYILLTDDSNLASFELSNSIGLTSFDALTNSGESIVLKDQLGNSIDSLTYDLTWYQDDAKKDGGYSLELIDPLQPCSDQSNWLGSTDAAGGTPGVINSVFNDVDNTAPQFTDLTVIGTDTLSLAFSEAIDESSISISSFTLSGYTFKQLSSTSYSKYYLILNEDLQSEQSYNLELSGISDCRDNEMISQTYSFYHDIKPPELVYSVFLSHNEVALIFDEPLTESSAEDEENFSFSTLTVDRATLQDSSKFRIHISIDEAFVLGSDYSFSYSNISDTIGNKTATEDLVWTFTSDVDTAFVEALNLLIIQYDEIPLVSAANNTLNYLLEGTESRPIEVVQDKVEMKKFRLSFENNFDENTDLKIYISNLFNEGNSARLSTPAYRFEYDTRAPSIEEITVMNDSQLVVTFNEHVLASSALLSSNYTLEDDEQPTSIERLSSNQYLLSFQNKFPQEQTKSLFIQMIQDVYGNKMSTRRRNDFVYDTQPPMVDAVWLMGSNELLVTFSEQVDKATALDPTNYELNDLNPSSLSIYGPDSVTIGLSFASVSEAAATELAIAGVEDLSGNPILDITSVFNSLNPSVVQLYGANDSTVRITFSHAMTGSAAEVANYSIEGFTIDEITEVDDINYSLGINSQFEDGDSLRLTLSNISAQNGETPLSQSYEGVFETYLNNHSLINSQTLLLDFETEFSSISKSNFEIADNSISIALLDGADKSIIRISLSEPITANIPTPLSCSGLIDKYGRPVPDFSTSVYLDTELPVIDTLTSDYYSLLSLTFSEKMNQNDLKSINKYKIIDVAFPVLVSVANDSSVLLDFNDWLVSGNEYQLIVSPLSDLSSNLTKQDTIQFTYNPPALPGFKDIVINEVMVDPSPSVGMPEVEYVELYNVSELDYNLRGLELSDFTTTSDLPEFILLAGSYVTLVDEGNGGLFDNAIEVDLPSLGNSTDQLTLRTIFGETIDEIEYSLDWYQDTHKDDGGYSLELIDPLGSCDPSVNWVASSHINGGTPGYENSVYRVGQDNVAPVIDSFELVSTDEIRITFNEPMDSASVANAVISLDLGIEVDHLEITGDFFQDFGIFLDSGVNPGIIYQIQISGARDCSGTPMEDYINTVALGITPKPGDLIITELMADPEPSVGLPVSEYVEVYNTTDSLVSLSSVQFRDDNTSASLSNINIPAKSYFILCPSSSVSSFTSYGTVVGVTGWPSLTNSGEQINLFTTEVIDVVTYSNDWFQDAEKSDGGYSLEMINPFGSCDGSSNWIGSEAELGGTPGSQNSVHRIGPDLVPPIIEVFEVVSQGQISITFNESMDSLSLIQSIISFTPSLEIGSVAVSGDNHEELMINLAESIVFGVSYEMEISGAEDCSGTEMTTYSNTVALGITPKPGDLIITEIMADPEPSVGLPISEYVEVYNTTDSLISLGEVRFRDATSSRTLPPMNIPAKSYAILCPANYKADFEQFGFVIGLSSWPTLTNSGEQLSLFSEETLIEVMYSNDWFRNSEHRDGGYSLEIINPFGGCDGSSNWTGSLSPLGGTPGAQNSVYNEGPDNTKPMITAFEVADDQTLRFTFNEQMDSLSLIAVHISGVTVEDRVVSGDNFEILTVSLFVPLAKDREITIGISGAQDCSGNEMALASFNVGIGVSPNFNELIISEIMADPEPVVGLPPSEYLEIFNTSDKLISLSGLTLSDDNNLLALPSVTISSRSYLLLTPTSSVTDFPDSIDIVGVVGWNSLNNGGELLTILSENNLVFQIAYSNDWYTEDLDGGVSLEMKDLNNPCGGAVNWGSSTASQGGSPGYANASSESVPDNFGPRLIGAEVLSGSQVLLRFDEDLSINAEKNIAYVTEPELDVASTSFYENDRRALLMNLKTQLLINEPVTIQVFGLLDCLGNGREGNQITIVLPDMSEAGDILLNEVLFNPRSGGVDFVELYNQSEKYLDIEGWFLGRAVDDNVESRLIDLSHTVAPNGYVAMTTDTISIRNQYPKGKGTLLQLSSIPNYPNEEGSVVLLGPQQVIMDRFDYSDDYHLAFLDDVDGVSLERINASAPTNDKNNWTSASSAVGYATPGYVNSQSFEAPATTAKVKIEPKVFVPGSVNPAHQSFTTINYQLSQSGQFANITIFNQMGQPVTELARGTTLSTSGFIRWDGTSSSGDRVRMGYYIVLFELYDGSGNKQLIKETVVVGR